MKNLQKFIHLSAILLASLVLNGCIWGNGSEALPVQYTGKTTPVEIDGNNGKDITAGAFSGMQLGSAGTAMGAEVEGEPSLYSGTPIPYRVATLTLQSLQQIHNMEVPAAIATGATTTVSGDCGGTATGTDNGTSASIKFDDYCSFGITFSGGMSYSGSLMNPVSAVITYSQLRMRGAGFDLSMNGTIDLNENNSGFSFIANMVYRDNLTGDTIKLENYDISFSGGNGLSLSINGRVYLSNYGYVDITTLEPVGYQDVGGISGKIRFDGQNGYAILSFSNNQNSLTIYRNGSVVHSESYDWQDVFSAVN